MAKQIYHRKKRTRGRRAQVLAPGDLPEPLQEQIRAMTVGGESVVYIYGRLRLYRHGIKIDTLRKYVKKIRQSLRLPSGSAAAGVEVLADVIAFWILKGVSKNGVVSVLRLARQLRGISYARANR